jgi:large subunit ribosomal protein L3
MVGLIGKKVGMTQVFDEAGVLTPVTVIKAEPNVVVGIRTMENDGYSAVVLGSDDMKPSRATKPYLGQFQEGISPKKSLVEMRDFDLECKVGDSVGVDVLSDFFFVDIIGTSKGKGFQGVMKRHGFGGGRKTHGSKFHRTNGSTGQNTYPAKTLKGRKMAGRMGADRRTVQNLRVVSIDTENQLILVNGSVPGSKDSLVVVRDAKKKG